VDVASGNNAVSFNQLGSGRAVTVKRYPAGKGYDLVTGAGPVNAPQFVYELAGR
jgi:hypothetical protein